MIHAALLADAPDLIHAFTNRRGGGSRAPFAAMNLAFHVGDTRATVDANHALLADALGYTQAKLVHMRQIHSDTIVSCTPDMGFDRPPQCDALISDVPNQPLMVMAADCTPLLLFDPLTPAIAAVHAGRAGAFKNITGKTVHAMAQAYGTRPETLIAVLGPSICPACYEVNATIAAEADARGYRAAIIDVSGRICLDVNAIITAQLLAAGVAAQHIEHTGPCTACTPDAHFSYRTQRGNTGRQAGVIMLCRAADISLKGTSKNRV